MRAKNRLLWAIIGLLLLPSGVIAQQSQVWQPSLDAARRSAGQTNRLVLVFFCADWCQPCREMERDVFGQPNAATDLQANYVLAKVNVNHFPATAKEYGITGVPTTVVITPQGQAVATVPNRMAAAPYVAKLAQVAAGAKQAAAAAVAQAPPPAMPQLPPPAVPAKTDDRYADRYADRGTYRPSEGTPDRYAERSADRYAALEPRPSSPVTGPQFPGLPGPAENMGAPSGLSPEARVVPPPTLPGPPVVPPIMPPAAPAAPEPRVPAGPAPAGPALPGTPVAPAIPPAIPPAAPPTTPPAAPPATPTTPPTTAGFGLDGYCPVCLVDQRRWVAGNRQFGIEHRGRVYLFERAEERDRFWANPDLYTPILSGNDPVISLERGESVPGRREFGVFFGNRIYLFADKTSLEKFWKNPNQYANQALQAMRAAGPVNPRPPLR